MAQLAPIDFITLLPGSAGSFRGNINENFSRIKTYFENFKLGNGIIVSETQPTGADEQEAGDLWFKVLP